MARCLRQMILELVARTAGVAVAYVVLARYLRHH